MESKIQKGRNKPIHFLMEDIFPSVNFEAFFVHAVVKISDYKRLIKAFDPELVGDVRTKMDVPIDGESVEIEVDSKCVRVGPWAERDAGVGLCAIMILNGGE